MSSNLKRTFAWLLCVLAYVLAIINRSSFTSLGTTAQAHFHAEATIVSTFVMVQLIMYAGSQIPVGIILDRLGSSTVMTIGLTLMAIGQFGMGATDISTVAIIARVLVGAGDACMFVSMIRVIADWFAPKTIPVMNQISGLIGYGGQLIAVAPLASLVTGLGWMWTFMTLAILAATFAILIAAFLKESPRSLTVFQRVTGRKEPENISTGTVHIVQELPITEALPVIGPNSSGILAALKSLIKRPGVRLAFWVHLTTCFATNVFVLLWGLPFMTGGLGYDEADAKTIMSIMIVAIMCGSLVAGPIFSRFARYRVHITFTGALINLLCWLVILLQPGAAPEWMMLITVIVLGIGGPLSMGAFEIIRTHTPVTQRGIGTGIANMGGFFAALVAVLLVGVVLDVQGAGTPETYSMIPFKWAMGVLIPIFILGLIMILVEYPKARKYIDSKK